MVAKLSPLLKFSKHREVVILDTVNDFFKAIRKAVACVLSASGVLVFSQKVKRIFSMSDCL
jgi:hypothetical protein